MKFQGRHLLVQVKALPDLQLALAELREFQRDNARRKEHKRPNAHSWQQCGPDLSIHALVRHQIKPCQSHPYICEQLPASSEHVPADMSKHKFVHGGARELRQLLRRDFQRVRCDVCMALAKARERDRSKLQAEPVLVAELNL